jgi:hypothetical protein
MEKARGEGVEIRFDGCRVRDERGAVCPRDFSLQRLAVRRRVTRSSACRDRLERFRIGGHRANGVQIVIDDTKPRSGQSEFQSLNASLLGALTGPLFLFGRGC